MDEDSQGKSSRVLGAGRHGSGEGGEAAMDLCMEKGLENSQNRYLPAAADS
jgi:hypothetical protein